MMHSMPPQTMRFGPLVVRYDERALVPRAWTMLQTSWAAELASDLPPGAMLELCAGVGHIGQAAALATGRDLVQVDADPHACALAVLNAEANAVGAQVDVRCGDLATVVRADERFVVVIADPPYLSSDEVDASDGDPVHAVDGGPDGLALARRCLAVAGAHVHPAGVVLLQARGRSQVERLVPDVESTGLELVDVRTDGEERAVALLRLRAAGAGASR
ncbi:MAG: prmC 2 [Actinotalea sp.]|nr:prmC 2 [Actinotalea sp.]